jgi:hypothetical protein
MKHWLDKLAKAEEERRGFLRLAARESITDAELDKELAQTSRSRPRRPWESCCSVPRTPPLEATLLQLPSQTQKIWRCSKRNCSKNSCK